MNYQFIAQHQQEFPTIVMCDVLEVSESGFYAWRKHPICEIPTAQGWLYLAVLLDLYSRMVVGWSMSTSCDEELVANALHIALSRRRP